MPNPEHLKILKKGVDHWNQWRKENPEIKPNLSEGKFSGADLSGANLVEVNLNRTDLSEVRLIKAELVEAGFSGANLTGANLSSSISIGAYFINANLMGTDLTRAELFSADLSGSNLENAILSNTLLNDANLTNAKLHGANFNNAFFQETNFANVDLSKVKGLETCEHVGPSPVDHRTLIQSWPLPEVFLRGCGFPDQFIDNLPGLIGSLEPIQFYSCFISYSSKDDEFTKRLHADLQANNVRCWFAPEDMKIGDKIRPRIDEVIHVHDKLLLVLSEDSVNSEWVEKEVETALEKERERKETVLFPIRLDDSVMDLKTGWPADIKRSRHIGDFTNWKDQDSFQKAFDRLLRDLGKEE